MRTRGVDPDADVEDAEKERLTRIILKMTESGGYHEGPESTLLKWILGVLSALSVAAIVSGIALYGDVQTLKSQVAYLTRVIEPHYQGHQ